MRSADFRTPEEAALDGFPARYCRVAASASAGDDAYVVVDVEPADQPNLYGVSVSRRNGGWLGGSSGNGPGWTLTDAENDLGTATVWGRAPEGTTRVRASYGGEVREAPVARGVYLVAWWRVPAPGDDPRVEAFRIHDRWVPHAAPRTSAR
jgi:hypothetical protein